MSEPITFTRQDSDLLASLKAEVGSLKTSLDSAVEAVTGLTNELASLKEARASDKGFLRGALWAFGTVCAAAGGGVVWLLQRLFGGP